jgi:glycerophosphoryl diester phosphodiesterase
MNIFIKFQPRTINMISFADAVKNRQSLPNISICGIVISFLEIGSIIGKQKLRVMNHPSVLIIAHRGESYDAPENTIGAINLAWERGAAAVEVDVHMTSDKQICVIHDYDTFRTTGKRLMVKETPMTELQKPDAGIWKNPSWANQRIPSLKEVLATVPSHGKIIIEIKSLDIPGDNLCKVISDSHLRNEQVEIIAFSLKTITKLKKELPQYKMLWLVESRPRLLVLSMRTDSLIRKAHKSGLDGINIGDSRYLTHKLISRLKSAGLLVYTWTVNNPVRARELASYGVDAITTDRAAWMQHEMNSSQIS